MGKPQVRYVAKAIPKVGWRIWNRKTKRWWGNYFAEYPQKLLNELNGSKRTEELIHLTKSSYPQSKR